MTTISDRVRSVLDQDAIPYEAVHHRRFYSAQETARVTGTPGNEFAKVVLVRADDRFVMAVLPAHHRVNLGELRRAAGAHDVRLATEDEIRELCPDCEVGAEPPFGNLYGVPVYVSAWMMGDETITFNAGTHEDVVRIKFRDFLDLVHPQPAEFSAQN